MLLSKQQQVSRTPYLIFLLVKFKFLPRQIRNLNLLNTPKMKKTPFQNVEQILLYPKYELIKK